MPSPVGHILGLGLSVVVLTTMGCQSRSAGEDAQSEQARYTAAPAVYEGIAPLYRDRAARSLVLNAQPPPSAATQPRTEGGPRRVAAYPRRPAWYESRLDTGPYVVYGYQTVTVKRSYTRTRDRVSIDHGRVHNHYDQTTYSEQYTTLRR